MQSSTVEHVIVYYPIMKYNTKYNARWITYMFNHPTTATMIADMRGLMVRFVFNISFHGFALIPKVVSLNNCLVWGINKWNHMCFSYSDVVTQCKLNSNITGVVMNCTSRKKSYFETCGHPQVTPTHKM